MHIVCFARGRVGRRWQVVTLIFNLVIASVFYLESYLTLFNTAQWSGKVSVAIPSDK
jgi:hypothetical protein